MTTFACKVCGTSLTGDLVQLSDESLLHEKDGEPLLQPGTYFIETTGHPPAEAGDYLVSVEALINTKQYLEAGGRLNGCCGLDGLDGINELCINGHEVATVRTDCWLPSHAILSPSVVSAQRSAPADVVVPPV